MKARLPILLAGAGTLLYAGTAVAATVVPHPAVTGPRVLAGGEQLAFGAAGQPPAAFVIDAHGVSNAATGTMVGTPALGSNAAPTKMKVTCLTISGNDAIVSAVVSNGANEGQPVVAEIVAGTTPTNSLLRFSWPPFITAGAEPGCYHPVLAPAGQVTAGVQVIP